MRRYNMEQCSCRCVRDDINGAWVQYQEVVALEDHLDKLSELINNRPQQWNTDLSSAPIGKVAIYKTDLGVRCLQREYNDIYHYAYTADNWIGNGGIEAWMPLPV